MSKVSGLRLLGVGTNAKTIKGDGSEYLTAIMYLSPADLAKGKGLNTVCPMAILAGCKAGCLNSAGRGKFSNVQQARLRKTIMYRDYRSDFIFMLREDIWRFANYCKRKGVKPCVRLNGTSDIAWENHLDMEGEFSEVQFYDYTKSVNRLDKKLPSNYHLTMSYSEASTKYQDMVVDRMCKHDGHNMAVVFRDKNNIPKTFMGFPVVDGDKDDLRFLDPAGCVVALYAKGEAKKDLSGFVVG